MIAIVDYGMGNLRSVERGLAQVGAEAEITHDPEQVAAADAVVLPGVGAFGDAMDRLRSSGLDEALQETVRRERPLIGVCLGLQVLFEESDEAVDDDGKPARGLGLLPGRVEQLPEHVKVPHIGWNTLKPVREHPALRGLPPEPYVYFVHSFHAAPADDDLVVAECDYGGLFPAMLGDGPVLAMQFHPEKSGRLGLAMLANIAAWVQGSHRG